MAKGKKKMTTHKHTPNQDRPNGKSWKKHPQRFDLVKGKLISADNNTKGTAV